VNAPDGLIDAYKQYFDEDFNNRMVVVSQALSTFDSSTGLWGIDTVSSPIDRNTAVLAQYRELEEDEAYKTLVERLNELATRARDAIDAQRESLRNLRELTQEAVKQKRQAMHAPVLPIDIAQYVVVRWAALAATRELNEHIAVVNEALDAFKRKSGKDSLQGDIKKLTEDEKRIKYHLRRVNSAGTCTAYAAAKQGIIDLDARITKGEKDLAAEQSDYLKAFFDKINFYFTRFGSRHFTIGLEGDLDTLGYQPVLSLVVKYRGVVVNPQILGAAFSESDRRALALSIYWAKMAVLPEAERASTIAVLDDPVTSFDDARITSAIIQMRLEVPSLRQLIVFTHYHSFTRRWLDVEPVSATMGFHALTRNDETAGMVAGDPTEFLHTEHQKQYAKFRDFIAGKTDEAIGIDLRVFLETEVRERYRHQLTTGGKVHEQFEGVINYLAEIQAFPGDVAAELHFYRNDLNGPHHVANPRGRDDWATAAEQMLGLIYTRL
jgi:wobble nucleotide-excising tRNase